MEKQTQIGVGAAAGITLMALLEPHFFESHPILTGLIYSSLIMVMAWGFFPIVVGAASWLWRRVDRMWPQYLMAFAGCLFFVGLVAFLQTNVEKSETGAPPEGPLKVQAISFPFDHAEGVKTAGITWQKGYARTELMFTNSLSEVVSDLDVMIRPEFPIIKSSTISDFAKCQIGPVGMPPTPVILGVGPDGGPAKVAANDGPQDMNTYIVPAHRLYCDKLAAKTVIRVVLATVASTNDVMGPRFQDQRKDPAFVDVFLKYQVRGEKHDESFRLTFAN
jgi:hypothetical protein